MNIKQLKMVIKTPLSSTDPVRKQSDTRNLDQVEENLQKTYRKVDMFLQDHLWYEINDMIHMNQNSIFVHALPPNQILGVILEWEVLKCRGTRPKVYRCN